MRDASPDEALTKVRSQFGSAVIAFSRVEFVRIGPLTLGTGWSGCCSGPTARALRSGRCRRHWQRRTRRLASPDTLKDKSVAMQGLVALEYLLFGTGADDLAKGDEYRCRYALASSTLIAGLAATLDTEVGRPQWAGRPHAVAAADLR